MWLAVFLALVLAGVVAVLVVMWWAIDMVARHEREDHPK